MESLRNTRLRPPYHARGVRVPEIILLLLGLLTVPAEAQRTLTYRMSPGDQLIYDVTRAVVATGAQAPRQTFNERVQIWCLSQDTTGWTALFEFAPSDPSDERTGTGLVFTLDSAGRPSYSRSAAMRVGELDELLEILIRLPSAVHDEVAWSTVPDLYGRQRRYRNVTAASAAGALAQIEFDVRESDCVAALLNITRKGTAWFDRRAGIVKRTEYEQTADDTRTRILAVSQGVLNHGASWAVRRNVEAQEFLQTLQYEDALLQSLTTQPQPVETTRAALDRLWAGFGSGLDQRSNSPFLRIANYRRVTLRSAAEVLEARLALGRRWQDEARTWTLYDAEGHLRTSEEARSHITVECFWQAGSVWSLRALPQFGKLSASLRNTSAQMVTFNLDTRGDRGLTAAMQCIPHLDTILTGPLQMIAPLPADPLVRVVDTTGRVRGIWFGWQPDYAEAEQLARKLARELEE